MRIHARTGVVISVAALALLVILFGPVALLYTAALAGVGLMIVIMASTAVVALRNWQLDKLPWLHAPRVKVGKATTRRHAA